MSVLPVSELLNKPGVAFIGPVPAEIQMIQPFSAAVLKDAKAADLAKQLIAFLASAEARVAIRKSGMEPLGGR
jgi:molybdate transport system substrate-binding protein